MATIWNFVIKSYTCPDTAFTIFKSHDECKLFSWYYWTHRPCSVHSQNRSLNLNGYKKYSIFTLISLIWYQPMSKKENTYFRINYCIFPNKEISKQKEQPSKVLKYKYKRFHFYCVVSDKLYALCKISFQYWPQFYFHFLHYKAYLRQLLGNGLFEVM
jgi:hypothetical protein